MFYMALLLLALAYQDSIYCKIKEHLRIGGEKICPKPKTPQSSLLATRTSSDTFHYNKCTIAQCSW